MKLTGSQFGQFQTALLSAFPTTSSLSQMVSIHLDENLAAIAGGSNLREVAFNLLQWAEARNKTAQLLAAARAANSGNPSLRAINFIGADADVTTTALHANTQESFMHSFTDRPIHASHIKGLTLLVRDALSATDEQAERLLKRFFGEGVTYAELPNLGERAITRAIDKVIGDDHDIPETRVDELIVAIRGMTPDRRYCEKCGKLDLVRKAGRWTPTTQDTCPSDQGVFVAVAFPKPFRAWTDHKLYEPGTEVDANRMHITEEGLRSYINEAGGAVHRWIEASLARTNGALSLIDFADYLLWRSGIHANPESPAALVAVIRSLSDPSSFAFDETGVRLMIEKALKAKGAVIADVEHKGGVLRETVGPGASSAPRVAVSMAVVRNTLMSLFNDKRRARMIASDAGLDMRRVDTDGSMEVMWHSIMEEAQKVDRIVRIIEIAIQEYPSRTDVRTLLDR